MPCIYDDVPGSWAQQSEHWPVISDPGQQLYHLTIRENLVPYGSYVSVGNWLRLETQEYLDRVRAARTKTHPPPADENGCYTESDGTCSSVGPCIHSPPNPKIRVRIDESGRISFPSVVQYQYPDGSISDFPGDFFTLLVHDVEAYEHLSRAGAFSDPRHTGRNASVYVDNRRTS